MLYFETHESFKIVTYIISRVNTFLQYEQRVREFRNEYWKRFTSVTYNILVHTFYKEKEM